MRALLIAALLAGAAPAAHADCGIPTWMGTWTDSPVPLEGTLYMYTGDGRGDLGIVPAWEFTDGHGNAEAYHVSPTVVRVDYSGTPGSHLTVKTRYGDDYVYELDGAWRAPATAPRVLQYWHRVDEWTCSYSNSLMVQTDQETAAYRVTWVPAAGPKREFVMPAVTDVGRSALELGKINCSGESLPVDQLAHGGHLELVAIRVDRSEVAVTGLPYLISTAKLAPDSSGLSRAFMMPSTPRAAPHLKALVRADSSLGLVVLFVFIAGLYLAIHVGSRQSRFVA